MDNTIFNYYSKETLAKMLSAFCTCTGLPIHILDSNGDVLLSCTGDTSFCKTVQSLTAPQSRCQEIRTALCRKASKAHKSFLIECPCGLSSFVIPIMQNAHLICPLVVGPFRFHVPDPRLTADLAEISGLCTGDVLKLYESVNTAKVIPQSLLASIHDLIDSMFRLPDMSHAGRPQYYPKPDEVIKSYGDSSSYPYEKETLLISEIKSGNLQKANAVLNDLLGYVLFTKNGSLDTAKVRAIELCCVLSRVTIENGATKGGVLNFNNECITSIQTITDIYELGERLQEIAEVFISSILQQQKKSKNQLIQQATDYIALHYIQPITLEELATHVHLNPSYFSSLFKQNIGTSFKSYLNIIRTENSKNLLSADELSLVQVAAHVGFLDYNYFAKVFKKLVGLTPSQYRNQSISHAVTHKGD